MQDAQGLQDEQDDRTLVLRAQDGEVEAFEVLVDRHQARLFRIAYMVLHDRMDAEDVVQEALVLAWRRLELLEDPGAFRSWLSRIVSRRATEVVRRSARRATDSADHEDLDLAAHGSTVTRSAGPEDPERAALAHAQLEALARLLQGIEESLRTCWVLREVEGMSYREIARAVDATETTVRGRIARARTLIVAQMEEWR